VTYPRAEFVQSGRVQELGAGLTLRSHARLPLEHSVGAHTHSAFGVLTRAEIERSLEVARLRPVGADALVVVTEWQEFRSPDFDRIKEMLSSAVIVDGRNLYDPKLLEALGFTYYGIGRGASE